MQLQNIHANGRKISLFCRDSKGEQTIIIDNTFYPFFYELDEQGKYTTYDGLKAKKVICSIPSDVPKMRSVTSYSSDIPFVKNYIINKIPVFTKCPIKCLFLDIEVLCTELPNPEEAKDPISCITIYNNFTKEYKTWYLGDCKGEKLLLKACSDYIYKEKPDLIIAWNGDGFDYPYLYFRSKKLGLDFSRDISPIKETRGCRSDFEKLYYPAGISMMDYMFLLKKVYMREQSYALDNIAQKYLEEKPWIKGDFSKLNPSIREKNINDVRRMVDLEEKFKIIEYFDEVRRLSKTLWEDIYYNSMTVEMMLFEEAKKKEVILPNTQRGDSETYEGAIRDCIETGDLYNIGQYDLAGAYPGMITNFCLDNQNIDAKEGIQIGEVKFKQNSEALMPSLIKKLLDLKDTIKKERDKCKLNTKEYERASIKYDAIKGIVNSCFTPDTDIITLEGIKNIKDVRIGDRVYNININTLEVEEDEIIDLQNFDYEGNIFNFKSERADLSITPEHKIIVKQGEKIDLKEIEYVYKNASSYWHLPTIKPLNIKSEDNIFSLYDIVKKYKGNIFIKPNNKIINIIRKISKYPHFSIYKKFSVNDITEEELKYLYLNGWEVFGQIKPKTSKSPIFFKKEDFCELLGWFMSEGCLSKIEKKEFKNSTRGVTFQIYISQYKNINPEYYKNICDVLDRMGFYRKYCNKHGISFCSEILYYYLSEWYYPEKRIPRFLFKENIVYRKAYFEAHYKGDGDKKGIRLSCKPNNLFQDLLKLIAMNGFNNIKWSIDGGCYRIYYGNNNKEYRRQISKLDYKGKVYCVTTKKNHTVFAGREGTFIPVGQCYGVYGLPSFRVHSNIVASTITFLVRDLLMYVRTEMEKEGYKVVYYDTDSCDKDSIIEINGEKKSIEEHFNSLNGDIFIENDKEYLFLINKKSPSLVGVTIKDKPILCLYRHKVFNKEKYKIKLKNGKIVYITNDHSIMIKRGKKFLAIKPLDIRKGDKCLIQNP